MEEACRLAGNHNRFPPPINEDIPAVSDINIYTNLALGDERYRYPNSPGSSMCISSSSSYLDFDEASDQFHPYTNENHNRTTGMHQMTHPSTNTNSNTSTNQLATNETNLCSGSISDQSSNKKNQREGQKNSFSSDSSAHGRASSCGVSSTTDRQPMKKISTSSIDSGSTSINRSVITAIGSSILCISICLTSQCPHLRMH